VQNAGTSPACNVAMFIKRLSGKKRLNVSVLEHLWFMD